MSSNPFTVSSPEIMDAAEMRRLYVPLAEDFEIEDSGHVFVHGHRGCGKSMMLRLMAPDCKMLEKNCAFKDLPYLGVYASIKSTDLDLIEFDRIKNQFAGTILAEHSLCLFIASKILQSLKEHTSLALKTEKSIVELNAFSKKFILSRLSIIENKISASDPLQHAIDSIDNEYSQFMHYMRQLSLLETYTPYIGKVIGYREFLFPLCTAITTLTCMPFGKPVYILLDDADNLNSMQTQVLNTWVSYRTGAKLSFKISTQLSYKHYRTLTNQRIEVAHDFKEVNISTIYTGGLSKGKFPSWVEAIVNKRLKEHGINISAKDFFPEDPEQVIEITQIGINLKNKWESTGTSYRPNDDAYRYSRPDYIKNLGGTAKQTKNYSYSGFNQLVHISSGIVRYFLDNAASMYAEEKKLALTNYESSNEINNLNFVRSSIQDQVVRSSADALMIDNLDKLVYEADFNNSDETTTDEFKRLRNLIQALGGIFQSILFSNRSERRVFSIALSDSPPDEVMKILKLGVRHGYLYEGTIGTKDGRGRTRRFVLTRRLAPMFKLDPTGFSGYLFVTTQLLQEAIYHPAKAIREFENGRLGTVIDEAQLTLEL